ncbi:hypothetical protein AZE42_13450, partial [Rhizopogon vesiculosus]
GTSLIPTDPQGEALFEQAASIEAFNFSSFVAPICAEKVFKPLQVLSFSRRRGLQTNEDKVTGLLAALIPKLDAYNVILGKQKYLAGNDVTLADLTHLPYGTMFIQMYPELFESKPHLIRWWNAISSRPAWLAVKDGA